MVTSLKRWHKNRDLHEDKTESWRESIPSRRNSARKGPEAGINLVSLRDSKRSVWLERVKEEGKISRCREMLLYLGKEFSSYSRCHGKPRGGFKQGEIRLRFFKNCSD